ncbi:alpha/beta hydrolase [Phytoactinopolyspora endophytica]|uniref:alpha/beta hydrolase n=1 Tax=Phytoactinopolyspora endophytica TaxID=1642495 RepID=UPI00101D28D5|nr:alpha/beta hydrolase [Phytoactinopolyspora endophytica]
MTHNEADINRLHWQRCAANDYSVPWEALTTQPEAIKQEWVGDDLWLWPEATANDAVLLSIHGGGFVGASVSTHGKLFGHIAVAAATSAYAVEYGLVPDHVYPSQIDAVTAVYRRIAADRPVALLGDSAGGTLALGIALRARDEGLPRPRGLYLISPWTDMEVAGNSFDTSSDPFFGREIVRGLAAGYLDGTDPRTPVASPLYANHRDLPPTYIQAGEEEGLLDDSLRLAERMRTAGVNVELDVVPGELHTFQMTAGNTAAADDAIRRAGTWLRHTLGA